MIAVVDRNKELGIAIKIASEAHVGQFDRQGLPYIMHPLAVMNRCDAIEEKIVAILHDVLEDCKQITKEILQAEGISSELIKEILLLTRTEDVKYSDYIYKISKSKIARRVKMADLQENSRLDRMYEPLNEKHIEKKVKYMKSYVKLLTADKESE